MPEVADHAPATGVSESVVVGPAGARRSSVTTTGVVPVAAPPKVGVVSVVGSVGTVVIVSPGSASAGAAARSATANSRAKRAGQVRRGRREGGEAPGRKADRGRT